MADYTKLWRQLETVAIPALTSDALDRLEAAARKEFPAEYAAARREVRTPLRMPWGVLQRLAAAIVFIAVGATLAIGLKDYLGDAGPGDVTADTRSRYLFIMTATQEAPEQTVQMQSEVQEWFAGLVEQGIMESGIRIPDGPPVGTPPDGTLLNGPVVGFMVIRAADHQEARRIAVSSPIIDYGGFIEIRAMDGGGQDQ
jgi:hypothetical protein